MKKNMNNIDRIVRVIIFAVTVILFFAGITEGTLGFVLIAVGAILLLTSLINFCPIYKALGISTAKKD